METAKKAKLVPELRFREFQNNWKKSKLGELTHSISSGKTKSSTEGEYNVYGSTGVIGKTNDFTHEGEFILIARVGANAGLINRVSGKYSVTDNTLILDLKKELDPRFCESFLIQYNLNKLVFGSGQPLITGGILKGLNLNLPSLPEQQKIASFLSKLDEKIAHLSKKKELLEEYKKGVTQKIFKQEIRFKIPNEDGVLVEPPKWEKRKLGELLIESIKRSTISNQYKVLSSTAKGLYSQSEYFSREIASTNNAGYKILEKDQLVFSPQNLWMGNINVNDKFEIGIVSPSYKIFDFNKKLTSPSYCKYFLATPRMKFEYAQSSEQGASIVRRNLDMASFKSIILKLPSLSEQNKIADFLSTIDKKISAVDQQLSLAKEWKKGLLQKMFV